MNHTAVARHYDKLTPAERFPLIVAAAGRGDDAERERLVGSAPRATFTIPHHWGAATAFEFLAYYEFMTVLDFAGQYLEACARAIGRKPKKGEPEFAAWDQALELGYEVKTHLAGWRAFCNGISVEPFVMWQILPGFATARRAEALAEGCPDRDVPGAAFVAEGVARYRARTLVGDPEWDVDEESMRRCWPVTVNGIATALRTIWEEKRKQWE